MRAQSELGEAFALLEGERIVYINRADRAADGPHRRGAVRARVGLRPRRRPSTGGRSGRGCATPASASSRGTPSSPRSCARTAAASRSRRQPGPLPAEGDDRLVIIARDITERHHQEAERERLLRTEQAARRASEAAHARVAPARRCERAPRARGAATTRRCRTWPSCSSRRSRTRRSSTCSAATAGFAASARRRGRRAAIALLAHAGRGRAPRSAAPTHRSRARCASSRRRSSTTRPSATCATSRAPRRTRAVPRRGRPQPRGRAARRPRAVGRGPHRGLAAGRAAAGARTSGASIEALAQRIALAVDSALQYQERAYVARTLQQSLLPARCRRCRASTWRREYVAGGEGMEVGGDFFDVFAIGDADEWALVIGDVAARARRRRP